MPFTDKGLSTVWPTVGLDTAMGAPGAGVSGGLVVDVVVDTVAGGWPTVLVGDWADTAPEVVDVVVALRARVPARPWWPDEHAPSTAAATIVADTAMRTRGRIRIALHHRPGAHPAGWTPGGRQTGTVSDGGLAEGSPIPDLTGPGLSVLFCGINPGLRSAVAKLHFAGPGNRFWKVLHGAGFTDRVLRPDEQHVLPGLGVGITNLVSRPSARADELTRDELRAGAAALERRVARMPAPPPRWLAFVGMTAYRVAFTRAQAVMGPQPDRIGPAGVWLLPNPSGLQAHYSLAAMVEAYTELREACE